MNDRNFVMRKICSVNMHIEVSLRKKVKPATAVENSLELRPPISKAEIISGN
jgi:hypothetical protein